ncbi:MAG: hypothetical protein ACPGEC_04120 [Flavobacteriales bacterium]
MFFSGHTYRRCWVLGGWASGTLGIGHRAVGNIGRWAGASPAPTVIPQLYRNHPAKINT